MNPSESRTLWISVGAALFAILLLYSWSQSQRQEINAKFKVTKSVIVATKDINEMATIDESMLEAREVPEPFAQPGFVQDASEVVGQVAAAPIRKGEQILQTKLLLAGPETGLSLEVSPGKRAITLPIDDMRGVSRLMKPGDRIDVVAALDFGKGADARREVRTIFQDVTVLATGLNMVNKVPRRLELDPSGKSVTINNLNMVTNFTAISIEVNPEEVQKAVFIMSVAPGNIFVSLRHPNDRVTARLPSVTIDSFQGGGAEVVRIPSAAPPVIVQPEPQAVPRSLPKQKRGRGFEDL